MLYSQHDSHVPRNNLKANHAVLHHVPFLSGKCHEMSGFRSVIYEKQAGKYTLQMSLVRLHHSKEYSVCCLRLAYRYSVVICSGM